MLIRHHHRGEQGFSLVELLVVLVLTGVVGGVVANGVIQGMQASQRADARIQALSELQRGIERVGRELRAADPLVFEVDLSDPDQPDFSEEVRAEVHRDGERLRFRYYLVDTGGGVGELREDVTRYAPDGTVVESRDGLFIADVANLQTGVPLFTYATNDPITGELVEITCTDPGDAGCRDQHVTATQVELRLQKLLPDQEPVMLETVVNIRNTRFVSPSPTP